MKQLLLFGVLLSLLSGCRKERGPRVDIYLLQSFRLNVNTATVPATSIITDAVLASEPFVADGEIASYSKSSTTFRLKKDIRSAMSSFGADKAFAVAVDGEPVYYGRFHPAYLSSMVFGLATIDPVMTGRDELKIHFVSLEGGLDIQALDKRNDPRILSAFRASRRLK